MESVWSKGYIHTHPHLGNWAIDFSEGRIKVTLIDMEYVHRPKDMDFEEMYMGHEGYIPIINMGFDAIKLKQMFREDFKSKVKWNRLVDNALKRAEERYNRK